MNPAMFHSRHAREPTTGDIWIPSRVSKRLKECGPLYFHKKILCGLSLVKTMCREPVKNVIVLGVGINAVGENKKDYIDTEYTKGFLVQKAFIFYDNHQPNSRHLTVL